MIFNDLHKAFSVDGLGSQMYSLMARLYPICRSITGDGVRDTLQVIQEYIPVTISEVASGTKVFDWTVPLEWQIRDAYIADRKGHRLVDFKQSNLHVVSYSQPVKARMTLSELSPRLHTLPDHQDWIPYRTSYYRENWGFCLSERQRASLRDGEEYDVCIDSSLQPGHLTYGECMVPGQTSEEVLVSCHVCHPSLCNDNLSGIVVSVLMAQMLRSWSLRYTYRFLFIPGTIGSITWLAQNQMRVNAIKHGLVVTGVGDAGPITYKRSRQGHAEIDRTMAHVLKHFGSKHTVIDFFPYGYDERQFCSPGFNLPVGCFMRTPHGQYDEYHTSADNLEFIQPTSLQDSLKACLTTICVLENNRTYLSQNPLCEPQLGKRGLYKNVGGQKEGAFNEMALLWVLNLSDGQHSLLDIAERAELPFETVWAAAEALENCNLLR